MSLRAWFLLSGFSVLILNASGQDLLRFSSASLSSGNGGESLDPNECAELSVVIRNDGSNTASSISAVLSTGTPGLIIVQQNAAYPNITTGATVTNITPFRISTSSGYACGTLVNLTLTVISQGGTNTFSFSLPSGSTNYVVTQTFSATIVPGTTDIGNHGDDVSRTILLPFYYTFYGQTFSNATLTSNGTLQFGGAVSDYINTCLPASGWPNAIFAHWDDLRTDGSSSGIFTSISGSAPQRIFNIEWRATYFSSSATLNFEVRLYEGQMRCDVIYGNLNGTGSGATVGIQKDSAAFTQFECNAGGLSAGLQLTFQPACANGGGNCPPPVADFFASPASGLAPLTVYFTNLSSAATNFSWDFGDGKTSTAANPVNTYTNDGSYTVSLTASGVGGTSTLARTNYILATNPPPAVANFVAGPTNGFAPLTINFTNLSSGATNFSWDFGDGNTSTNTNPINTYTSAGSYSVSLSVTGAGGADNLTRTNYIVVSNAPPLANFVADPTNGPAPLTVYFTNLSSGATNFSWNFGDGNNSTINNPTNIYTNSGSYTVTLTAIGLGGTNALARTNYIVVIRPAQLVVSPLGLDFGLIATGATVQATMIISNTGAGTLNGSGTATPGRFAIVSGTPFNVAASSATNLVISFTPVTQGIFSNVIVFASNGGSSTNPLTGKALNPPLILSPTRSGTNFLFSFATVSGFAYLVQFKDSLTDLVWQSLQSVSGDGTVKTSTVPISAASHRFYRISAQ